MPPINGAERKKFKSAAHHLKPVVQVGQKGVTDMVVKAVDDALESHELIKLKFMEHKEDKRQLSYRIADSTKSEVVGIIGNTVILFRKKKEKSKIEKD